MDKASSHSVQRTFFIGIIQIRSHILWNSYRYGYHFHNKTPPIRHIYFQYKTFAIFFQVITNYTYRNKSPVPVIRNMEKDKFPLQGGVKSLLQVGVRPRRRDLTPALQLDAQGDSSGDIKNASLGRHFVMFNSVEECAGRNQRCGAPSLFSPFTLHLLNRFR